MTPAQSTGQGSGKIDPESTSSGLVERLKAKDGEAWQRLVDLYGPAVYEWCRHCGVQAEDAADVAQDAFAAVARKMPMFRRERPADSFRGWLWTITRNKIRDHFRRRQTEPPAQGGTGAQERLAQVPDEPPSSSTTSLHPGVSSSLERRALELVRMEVEDRTWDAFWRVTVDGRAVTDVAEELGISAGAVYKAKYRVMQLVRRELADLIG